MTMPVNPEKEIRTLMKKFEALQNINRATWYEWRQAAIECAQPKYKPIDLVLKAWEVVGHDTAKAYFGMLDVSKPTFLEDIAKCIVMSSTMMGETAVVKKGDNEKWHLNILNSTDLKGNGVDVGAYYANARALISEKLNIKII